MAGTAADRRAPQRRCVACRRTRPKRDLVRIVRSPDRTVAVDPRGSAPGRGAYACTDDLQCLRTAGRRATVARALGVTLQDEDLARLATEIEKERTAT